MSNFKMLVEEAQKYGNIGDKKIWKYIGNLAPSFCYPLRSLRLLSQILRLYFLKKIYISIQAVASVCVSVCRVCGLCVWGAVTPPPTKV